MWSLGETTRNERFAADWALTLVLELKWNSWHLSKDTKVIHFLPLFSRFLPVYTTETKCKHRIFTQQPNIEGRLSTWPNKVVLINIHYKSYLCTAHLKIRCQRLSLEKLEFMTLSWRSAKHQQTTIDDEKNHKFLDTPTFSPLDRACIGSSSLFSAWALYSKC